MSEQLRSDHSDSPETRKRRYVISLSIEVAADVADETEFFDTMGQFFEGPAFGAMERAIEEGWRMLTEQYPEERWTYDEMSIDSHDPAGVS